MSLARAFTKRYKPSQQLEEPAQILPARAMTVKRLDKPIDRAQISLPIELISTTNVLALEAPDIHPNNVTSLNSPLTAPSSAASFKSYDSDAVRSSASSMTSPDLSRESSPTVSEPKPSSYFPPTTKVGAAPGLPATPKVSSFQENHAPSIPTRALSHTKKTHQALAHKRSMRLSDKSDKAVPPPAPLSPSKASKPTSVELPIQTNALLEPSEHPFGAELAQVKEVAEDFGVQIWDEEEQFLHDQGFGKYGAEDYMMEIRPLFSKTFDDVPYSPSSWL